MGEDVKAVGEVGVVVVVVVVVVGGDEKGGSRLKGRCGLMGK